MMSISQFGKLTVEILVETGDCLRRYVLPIPNMYSDNPHFNAVQLVYVPSTDGPKRLGFRGQSFFWVGCKTLRSFKKKSTRTSGGVRNEAQMKIISRGNVITFILRRLLSRIINMCQKNNFVIKMLIFFSTQRLFGWNWWTPIRT